jgi:hypothetical protein
MYKLIIIQLNKVTGEIDEINDGMNDRNGAGVEEKVRVGS